MTNQEEVELRSKIEALGLEVTKVPLQSEQLDEVCGSPLETFSKLIFSFFPLLFGTNYVSYVAFAILLVGNSKGVG